MPSDLAAFAIAFLASSGLTPVARSVALKWGIVDHPGPRKVHASPMPLLGGLAIYVTTALVLMLFIQDESRVQMFSIMAAAMLVLLAGTLDDRGLLHHQLKLMVAMPLAAIILLGGDVRSAIFSPTVAEGFSIGLLADYALSFVWVVGITAAFSILDHLDGLCAGAAAVAAGFFLLFAALEGQILVGTLAATVFGGALGFLLWNFNPAKIFLGDAGAMFLGLMMATLGLKLRFEQLPHASAWLVPVLVLLIPIFDTTLVTVSRARRGLVPFSSPGKDHLAHRLVVLGFSHRAAVMTIYAFGTLGGLLALLVYYLPVAGALVLAACIFAAAALAIYLLERVPYERKQQ